MKINGECLLLVWYMNLTEGLKVDWNYACPLCHAMNLMSRKFGLTKVIWISSPFYDYSTKTITGDSMLFMACFYKYWQVCGAGRIVNEHSSPFLSGKTQKRWLTRYTSFDHWSNLALESKKGRASGHWSTQFFPCRSIVKPWSYLK